MIKVHIGRLLYNSVERQQPWQPPLRNVQQQVTSSLSEVESDLQSDVVDRVVGSSLRSSSDECHRRLILYQNPVQKHNRRQNMRETITLVGRR